MSKNTKFFKIFIFTLFIGIIVLELWHLYLYSRDKKADRDRHRRLLVPKKEPDDRGYDEDVNGDIKDDGEYGKRQGFYGYDNEAADIDEVNGGIDPKPRNVILVEDDGDEDSFVRDRFTFFSPPDIHRGKLSDA